MRPADHGDLYKTSDCQKQKIADRIWNNEDEDDDEYEYESANMFPNLVVVVVLDLDIVKINSYLRLPPNESCGG